MCQKGLGVVVEVIIGHRTADGSGVGLEENLVIVLNRLLHLSAGQEGQVHWGMAILAIWALAVMPCLATSSAAVSRLAGSFI